MNLKYASRCSRITPTALLALLCATLASCAQPYSVTLNNNVLFGPGAADRRGAVTADPGLQACLDQTLERLEQTDPARITLLACPGAGIETLAGIEALASLEQLELSDNDITDLGPLIALKNLRVLGLRNNEIGDVRALAELPILRFLTLEGNERVPCRQLDGLTSRLGNTFGRPQNCIN
ncbi:MAG TPA: leucine-rich repeat domain-containing protein [Pseudomonadales bacterium]